MRRGLTAAVLVGLAVMAGCCRAPIAPTLPGGAGRLAMLHFLYPASDGPWLPFTIAAETGLFERYGLDADVQTAPELQTVAAVIDGKAAIGAARAETVIAAQASEPGELSARRALRLAGLDPNKDVTCRSEPGALADIAALKAGEAKAFVAYPPDDVLAQRAGLHSVSDLSNLHLPYT